MQSSSPHHHLAVLAIQARKWGVDRYMQRSPECRWASGQAEGQREPILANQAGPGPRCCFSCAPQWHRLWVMEETGTNGAGRLRPNQTVVNKQGPLLFYFPLTLRFCRDLSADYTAVWLFSFSRSLSRMRLWLLALGTQSDRKPGGGYSAFSGLCAELISGAAGDSPWPLGLLVVAPFKARPLPVIRSRSSRSLCASTSSAGNPLE